MKKFDGEKMASYIILGIILLILASGAAHGDNYYLASDRGVVPSNFSNVMNQGFYYQQDDGSGFYNLTHCWNTQSANDSDWSPDAGCTGALLGLILDRNDFDMFTNNMWLYWHPAPITKILAVRFAPQSPDTLNLSINASYKTASSSTDGTLAVVKKVNASGEYIITNTTISSGMYKYNDTDFTIEPHASVLFELTLNAATNGDSSGLMVNISTSNASIASTPSLNLANGSSKGFMYDANHSGRYPWVFPDRFCGYNKLNVNDSLRGSVSYYNGSFYFVDDGDYIWKVNASNITDIQAKAFLGVPLEDGNAVIPAIYNDSIYVSETNGSIYQLSPVDLSVRNSFNISGFIQSSPLIWNGYLYVGTSSPDDRFLQLYAHNFSIAHSYSSGDNNFASPTCNADYCYFASRNGFVYQFSIPGFVLVATYNTGDVIASSPSISVDGQYIYIGSDSAHVYQLLASNISVAHSVVSTTFMIESTVSTSSDGSSAYYGTGGSRLKMVNASNISQVYNSLVLYNNLWTGPVLDLGGQVCFGDTIGIVYLVNESNSSQVNSFANVSDGDYNYNLNKNTFWDLEACIPYNDSTGYYAVIGSINGTLYQFYNQTVYAPPVSNPNINASGIISVNGFSCSAANNLTLGDIVNIKYADVNYSADFNYSVDEYTSMSILRVANDSMDKNFTVNSSSFGGVDPVLLYVYTSVNSSIHNISAYCTIPLCVNAWAKNNGACVNGTRTYAYTDSNGCATQYGKPSGGTEACTMTVTGASADFTSVIIWFVIVIVLFMAGLFVTRFAFLFTVAAMFPLAYELMQVIPEGPMKVFIYPVFALFAVLTIIAGFTIGRMRE